MYKIPKIKWQVINHGQVVSAETTNTFVEYSIKPINNEYYCFYGNGKHKIFKCVNEAKEWVEQVHYPAQIEKYLDRI